MSCIITSSYSSVRSVVVGKRTGSRSAAAAGSGQRQQAPEAFGGRGSMCWRHARGMRARALPARAAPAPLAPHAPQAPHALPLLLLTLLLAGKYIHFINHRYEKFCIWNSVVHVVWKITSRTLPWIIRQILILHLLCTLCTEGDSLRITIHSYKVLSTTIATASRNRRALLVSLRTRF